MNKVTCNKPFVPASINDPGYPVGTLFYIGKEIFILMRESYYGDYGVVRLKDGDYTQVQDSEDGVTVSVMNDNFTQWMPIEGDISILVTVCGKES